VEVHQTFRPGRIELQNDARPVCTWHHQARLWRTGRRNAQCDEACNTRHPVKVPVVSTHDRSLVT
jgi:hypothetical protein